MICGAQESRGGRWESGGRLELFLCQRSKAGHHLLAPLLNGSTYTYSQSHTLADFVFDPVKKKTVSAYFQSDMASGVKVDEVVKLKYDDIKKKKSYRYLVFYIKDEKVIQVEKVGDRNADYQEFLQDLYVGGPDDCR